MRTLITGILVLVMVVTVGCVVWWNATRIEAWASDKKREREAAQERQRVENAKAFLRKGLEELDAQIGNLESARYEQRVSAEEDRLRHAKQRSALTDVEDVAVTFLRAQRDAHGGAFECFGRQYDGTKAEAQAERFVADVVRIRDDVAHLKDEEVLHDAAGAQIERAVERLKDARERARREGDALVVERDVADARALAIALETAKSGGGTLSQTMEALRKYIDRQNATANVDSSGTLDARQARERQDEQNCKLQRARVRQELGERVLMQSTQ